MSGAVLFAAFGGPERPADVMPFLERVTRGRGIPRERLLVAASHYERLGGRSPIAEITRRQAAALQAELAKAGDARRVYVGQRHSAPFLDEALAHMRADGVRRATVFVAAAHRCAASLERYVEAIESARAKLGPGAPEIEYAAPWSAHPLFVEAIAARAAEKPLPAGAPWLFTAHSIPCAMAKESAYVEELRTTAALVARRLGVADWAVAYTSRSGGPRDAWLEPDVSPALRALAARGARDVVVAPIGFVVDHVEVLYDLDVEAKAAADAAGARLHRLPTVGDHPLFAAMAADVLRALAGRASSARPAAAGEPPACYCFPGESVQPCRGANIKE